MSDFHDILIIVLKLLDEKVISSPGPSRKWEKPFSFCTLIVTPIKCRTKASIYEYWYSICFHLTLSWRQPLSYRNQSNQWTGFYMITASVMKELSILICKINSSVRVFPGTILHVTQKVRLIWKSYYEPNLNRYC